MRGRPRSETSRRAILEATAALIAELGYDAMTIEAIAARAGAGRQTVYRWWSSRSAVVADAIVEGYLGLAVIVIPDDGTLKADLKSWLVSTSEALTNPLALRVVRGMVAAAAADGSEADQLYENITGPHVRALIARLEVGKTAGELFEDVSSAAVADALMGTILFQILARPHQAEKLTAVVDALLPSPNERLVSPLVQPGDQPGRGGRPRTLP